MAQRYAAFNQAATWAEPIWSCHHGVNSLVENVTFALYRDNHEAHRNSGEEKF